MFWKRTADNRVRIYFYDPVDKKQKVLPRTETAHLDGERDEVIDQWVGRKAGLLRVVNLDPKLIEAADTVSVLDRFCEYLATSLNRKKVTIAIHRLNLSSYALPYFHHVCKVKTFQEYQLYSRRLGPWLRDECATTESKARYVQMSLRVFWRWLVDEGLVESGDLVMRRITLRAQATPLKFALTPETVMGWQTPRLDLKLLALIGYFFSLRPQETFALERADFVAGERAAALECCSVMSASGLFGRLAVRVNKQRSKDGLFPPKLHSKGVVACFHERAARNIISLLNARTERGTLFPLHPGSYLKAWRTHGIPNTTLKDLRRASLYHLGHYSKLEIVGLKNHARHREISTTALYTRRPEEDFDNSGEELDLE